MYTHITYHSTCYILPFNCLLAALDAHMFSHNGYGPGTKAQGAAGPEPQGSALVHPLHDQYIYIEREKEKDIYIYI